MSLRVRVLCSWIYVREPDGSKFLSVNKTMDLEIILNMGFGYPLPTLLPQLQLLRASGMKPRPQLHPFPQSAATRIGHPPIVASTFVVD